MKTKIYHNKRRQHKVYFYGQKITEKEIELIQADGNRFIAIMDGMQFEGHSQSQVISKIIKADL